MSQTESTTSSATKASPWWQRIPLTLQILIALVAAISVGIALGAGNPNPSNAVLINNLAIPAELVLKALRALATPLIFAAVLPLMTTNIPGTAGRRLAVLLLTNTRSYLNRTFGSQCAASRDLGQCNHPNKYGNTYSEY